MYIYTFSREESTCQIYYKVFTYEINQNEYTGDICYRSLIQSFVFSLIRFILRRIMIQKVPDDIHREYQSMEMSLPIVLASETKRMKIFIFAFFVVIR